MHAAASARRPRASAFVSLTRYLAFGAWLGDRGSDSLLRSSGKLTTFLAVNQSILKY